MDRIDKVVLGIAMIALGVVCASVREQIPMIGDALSVSLIITATAVAYLGGRMLATGFRGK